MAVTSLGSATSNTAGTTVVATATANASVGDKVICCVGGGVVSAPTVTVTDSAGGNTHTSRQQTNTTWLAAIFECELATAITSGVTTFTATWSTTNTAKMISVIKVDDLLDASAYDVGTTALGTALGWSSGAAATTAQANELLVGLCASDSTSAETNTPSGSWVEIHDLTNGNAFQLATMYQYVTSTGTYSADGTWTNSGSRSWRAMIGTFKKADAGGGGGENAPEKIRVVQSIMRW